MFFTVANGITLFEKYLLTAKKVSHNTLLAYTKDISDFLHFLAHPDGSLPVIKADDFISFLQSLHHNKISSSTAHRKKAALKVFCHFIHTVCKMPDYRSHLVLQTSFPLLCDEVYVREYVEKLSVQSSFHALQKAVIFSLLATGKVSVKQLLLLKQSDIKASEGKVALSGQVNVGMPRTFFDLIDAYKALLPAESTTLFPVKVGNSVKPITRSGIWAILKSVRKNDEIVSFIEINQNVTSKKPSLHDAIRAVYKKSHPRW